MIKAPLSVSMMSMMMLLLMLMTLLSVYILLLIAWLLLLVCHRLLLVNHRLLLLVNYRLLVNHWWLLVDSLLIGVSYRLLLHHRLLLYHRSLILCYHQNFTGYFSFVVQAIPLWYTSRTTELGDLHEYTSNEFVTSNIIIFDCESDFIFHGVNRELKGFIPYRMLTLVLCRLCSIFLSSVMHDHIGIHLTKPLCISSKFGLIKG